MIDKNRVKEIVNLYTDMNAKLRDIVMRDKRSIDIEELLSTNVVNLFIEPTNRCNLHCKFCARDNMERNLSSMTFDMFKNVITGLKRGSYITITGNGEPLINPEIYHMIEYASNEGNFVSVITNGTALTDENADKLIASGLSRIQFSFQSIDKSVYEETMLGANYERTLSQILNFIYKVRESKSNIFISISTVMTEENQPFVKQSKDYWMKMPIDNYYEGELLSLQTNSKMYEQTLDNRMREKYKVCVNPWVCAKINADGSVNPCVQDFSSKYIIGNVKENTFNEIINGEEAKRFRKAVMEGNQQFLDDIGYRCRECNAWTDKVGYNIEEYLKNTYPIIFSLAIDEIGTIKQNYDLSFLEEVIKR